MTRWTRCCCWCPRRGPATIAGQGDFHMKADGRLARRREGQGRAVRLHRHPDGFEAAAARRARGAFLDQHLVGPGDRGGPLLRRGPPGAVVRRRQSRGDQGDRARPSSMAEAGLFQRRRHRRPARLFDPRPPQLRRRAGHRADQRDWPRSAGTGPGPDPAAQQSRGPHGDRGIRPGQRRRTGAAAADRGRRSRHWRADWRGARSARPGR